MTNSISKTAIIHDNVKIGKNVIIHDYVVIYPNSVIKDGVEINRGQGALEKSILLNMCEL